MGSSVWKPGRRPQKVDFPNSFTASNVAVGVVSLFGHVDGVERTVGDPVLVALQLWPLLDVVSEA
jgi:hypothetical protein